MADDMRETTMTARIARGSQSSYARFAGLMYLFTAFDITGVVILSRIRGGGTFLAAAHSIAESETLYHIGLLCGLVGTLSTVLLAIGLYVTLKPVDGNLAMTALLFRLAESVLGAVAIVFSFAVFRSTWRRITPPRLMPTSWARSRSCFLVHPGSSSTSA